MTVRPVLSVLRLIGLVASAASLGACGNTLDRLANVGEQPPLTRIQNPTAVPGYQPVSMPMPAPMPLERSANSLWRPGARAFFKDQRANQVGDILTVLINISEQAQISNATTRSRNNTDSAALNSLLGYESGALKQVLPEAVNPSNLVDLNSKTNNNGSGTVNRSEAITLKVAAVVTQILPNGNLAIQGHQEVRVNFEVRVLEIAGVIRPQDIAAANTIGYDKIAEARIGYGGRGQITDVQQPRYGQQILDVIFPF